MLKLVVGLIFIGVTWYMASEYKKYRKLKSIERELSDVKLELEKAEIESEVVDNVVKLKQRKNELERRYEMINKMSNKVEK